MDTFTVTQISRVLNVTHHAAHALLLPHLAVLNAIEKLITSNMAHNVLLIAHQGDALSAM